MMIFVVPRELKTCTEPVEFDDGKLPEPESTGLILINQPAGDESEIVTASDFKTLKSGLVSGF